MKTEPRHEEASDLPQGLAQPARRALVAAGYERLEQLSALSEAEVAQLHGIGPNALAQLRRALAAKGLSFGGRKARGRAAGPQGMRRRVQR